jgi:hypothetical protein
VLVLDDLHAADEPSLLLLLRFVTRELEDSRLVIVGAYRDVDPTLADPLTTTVTEPAREPVSRAPGLHDPVRAPRSDPRRAARGRRERRPDRRDDLLQRVRAARRPATERVRCRVQPRPGAHYAAAGIPVADVAGAFQGHVCAWTWFCTIGNLHPNGDGYAAIARAFLAALPAANSARHEAPR